MPISSASRQPSAGPAGRSPPRRRVGRRRAGALQRNETRRGGGARPRSRRWRTGLSFSGSAVGPTQRSSLSVKLTTPVQSTGPANSRRPAGRASAGETIAWNRAASAGRDRGGRGVRRLRGWEGLEHQLPSPLAGRRRAPEATPEGSKARRPCKPVGPAQTPARRRVAGTLPARGDQVGDATHPATLRP